MNTQHKTVVKDESSEMTENNEGRLNGLPLSQSQDGRAETTTSEEPVAQHDDLVESTPHANGEDTTLHNPDDKTQQEREIETSSEGTSATNSSFIHRAVDQPSGGSRATLGSLAPSSTAGSSSRSILDEKERMANRRIGTGKAAVADAPPPPSLSTRTRIMDEKERLANRKVARTLISPENCTESHRISPNDSARGILVDAQSGSRVTMDEEALRSLGNQSALSSPVMQDGGTSINSELLEGASQQIENPPPGESVRFAPRGEAETDRIGDVGQNSDMLYIAVVNVPENSPDPLPFVIQEAEIVNEEEEEERMRHAEERGRRAVIQRAVRATSVHFLPVGHQVIDESAGGGVDDNTENVGNKKKKKRYTGYVIFLAVFAFIAAAAAVVGITVHNRRGNDASSFLPSKNSTDMSLNLTSFSPTAMPIRASSPSLRPIRSLSPRSVAPLTHRPTATSSMAPTTENLQCVTAQPIFADGTFVNDTLDAIPLYSDELSSGYPGCYSLNDAAFFAPARWYRLNGNGMTVTATFCNQFITPNATDLYLNETGESYIRVYSGNCTFTCQSFNQHRVVGNCIGHSWYAERNVPYIILVRNSPELEGINVTGQYSLMIHSNDQCEYASEIRPGSFQMGSNRDAVASLSSPVCDAWSSYSPGLWFWTRGTGETFSFDTCSSTAIDTKIDVFTGTCNQLQCVTMNDNAYRCSVQSSVSWKTIVNQLYFIYVYGDVGSFVLTGSSSPANDVCKGATDIDLDVVIQSSSPYLVNGTTLGATTRSDAVYFYDEQFTFYNLNVDTCDFFVDESPGVWYRLRASQDVQASVDVCDSPVTGNIQPQLSLLQGSCKNLTCVDGAVNYTSCSAGTETLSPGHITWSAKANTSYYLLVQAAKSGVAGDFAFNFNATTKS